MSSVVNNSELMRIQRDEASHADAAALEETLHWVGARRGVGDTVNLG